MTAEPRPRPSPSRLSFPPGRGGRTKRALCRTFEAESLAEAHVETKNSAVFSLPDPKLET